MPYSDTVIDTPMTFRQSATDADNHLKTNIAATYVQDQIDLSRRIQVVAGLRFDHFDLQYHNNRTGDNLRRIDNLVSPRAGIVLKAATPLSVYANYSVSYLPSSGRPVLVVDHDNSAGQTGEIQQLRTGSRVGPRAILFAYDGSLPVEPHQYAIHRSERSHQDRADWQSADQWLRTRD